MYSQSFYTLGDHDVKMLIRDYGIERAISSSTRKTESAFEKRIKAHVPLLKLSHKTPVPITSSYATPETLGKDRLAAVVGCTKLYPNKNCLVIDAGTCITYDYISKSNQYQGGNISPGLRMRAEAMDTMTSTLPLVEPTHHEDILGKSTRHALENGVVYGTLLEIESFIQLMKTKKTSLITILTGGDSSYLGSLLNSKIFVRPFLVLEGLDVILNYNAN